MPLTASHWRSTRCFAGGVNRYTITPENARGMQLNSLGLVAAFATTLSIAMALPAAAPHSHAMYSPDVRMTVEATVKEYIWANPHVWVYVEIPDENGNPAEWILESGAPGGLSRNGWSPQSMKPGDLVTVTFGPLKDGTSGGGCLARSNWSVGAPLLPARSTTILISPTPNSPESNRSAEQAEECKTSKRVNLRKRAG